MSDLVDQFIEATFVSDELELVIDASKLPPFDDSTLTPEEVAAQLGPLVGATLRAQAEFFSSTPILNASRKQHLAKVEASAARAEQEHQTAIEATLRLSPRGAALDQVASNELDASLQLSGTVTSMMQDMTRASQAMREGLEVLDRRAALTPVDEVQCTWYSVARGAINSLLSPAQ